MTFVHLLYYIWTDHKDYEDDENLTELSYEKFPFLSTLINYRNSSIYFLSAVIASSFYSKIKALDISQNGN